MNPWIVAVIGGAIGMVGSAVFHYLFAPAPGTTLDGHYQSRLDWALAEGDRAAAAREAELRAQFEAAKQAKPLPPPTAPSVPAE